MNHSEILSPVPWNVHSFDDFMYFCCPAADCTYKSKTRSDLLNHALENHPESKNLCILDEHSYSRASDEKKNENNKAEKTEAIILELVKSQKIEVEDEHEAIDIDTLNPRQYSALFGTSREMFDFYLELVEDKLKVSYNPEPLQNNVTYCNIFPANILVGKILYSHLAESSQ